MIQASNNEITVNESKTVLMFSMLDAILDWAVDQHTKGTITLGYTDSDITVVLEEEVISVGQLLKDNITPSGDAEVDTVVYDGILQIVHSKIIDKLNK